MRYRLTLNVGTWMLRGSKLRCTASINVFAGATARGWVILKLCQPLQSILPLPYQSHTFFRLFFAPSIFNLPLFTIYYLRLFPSSIFHINHGDEPTYSYSSHRNAAFETSPWSRRLNHLHSYQRCPYWVGCRLYRLSPVSACASPPKSIHSFSPAR